jgi:methyl-accepting chemotaxis protein
MCGKGHAVWDFKGTKSIAKLIALDALDDKVLITDSNLKLVYANTALLAFLQTVEAELQNLLPQFSLACLLGSNLNDFHKHTTYQSEMLAELAQPHRSTIRIGRHEFEESVRPLGKPGKPLGFLVVWTESRSVAFMLAQQVAAVSRNHAMIEFKPDGTVTHANGNFLKLMGYTSSEVEGKNHRMFVLPAERDSKDYADFWMKLEKGEALVASFRRITKDGKVITIQGAYSPILDKDGRVVKVVKLAVDVTDRVYAVDCLARAMADFARGDLSTQIDGWFSPEYKGVRMDFNQAMQAMHATMKQIVAVTHKVGAGAGEIEQAIGQLSQRTVQQAANLARTAATLDEITATVRKTAEGASEARGVVTAAKDDAERSGTVIRETVTAMDGISDSSKKIGNIIGVIDEIAFQTNLLALNAGVEAARAGDAGRGFAVVATEVRALAQRSADAAKEIKTLISASSQQVATGVSLVGETGRALTRIVDQVNRLNVLVVAIAGSVQEQATGLGEVNTAVNQMDEVTQKNAGMVAETTAASQSLAAEAAELIRLMGQFKLKEPAVQRGGAVAPPARGNSEAKTLAAAKAKPVAARLAPLSKATAGGDNWDEF